MNIMLNKDTAEKHLIKYFRATPNELYDPQNNKIIQENLKLKVKIDNMENGFL